MELSFPAARWQGRFPSRKPASRHAEQTSFGRPMRGCWTPARLSVCKCWSLIGEQRMSTAATPSERASTGIPGLDDILGGGLSPNRLYLIEGTPGTGKTTLALQFLIQGVRLGEP